jgi:hypothetical protein
VKSKLKLTLISILSILMLLSILPSSVFASARSYNSMGVKFNGTDLLEITDYNEQTLLGLLESQISYTAFQSVYKSEIAAYRDFQKALPIPAALDGLKTFSISGHLDGLAWNYIIGIVRTNYDTLTSVKIETDEDLPRIFSSSADFLSYYNLYDNLDTRYFESTVDYKQLIETINKMIVDAESIKRDINTIKNLTGASASTTGLTALDATGGLTATANKIRELFADDAQANT